MPTNIKHFILRFNYITFPCTKSTQTTHNFAHKTVNKFNFIILFIFEYKRFASEWSVFISVCPENLRKRYTRKAFLYWRRHVLFTQKKGNILAIEAAAKGFEYVHIVWMIVKVRKKKKFMCIVVVIYKYEEVEFYIKKNEERNSHIISLLSSYSAPDNF